MTARHPDETGVDPYFEEDVPDGVHREGSNGNCVECGQRWMCQAHIEYLADYDPTDVELGGLALSWHVSREACQADSTLTDGMD